MGKAWEKPKLVILVRAKPEETILNACKMSGSSVSPSAFKIGCDFEPNACEARSMTGISNFEVICGACSEAGAS
jgi:hypothetical protein